MKISEQEVSLVDHMGSDLSVVNAARVSFAKESDWEYTIVEGYADYEAPFLSERDTKLISYLAKHNHWTPFAHAFASFRIKAPIFVARQLGKHQVGLAWNEVSRRYVDDEPEFFFPKEWRGKPVNAKQGSDGVVATNNSGCHDSFVYACNNALKVYTDALHFGVAPEQARMILPQNMMTEWIWSGSLAAFARVCKLRLDPHVQLETQEIASKIASIMSELFPVSFKALFDEARG